MRPYWLLAALILSAALSALHFYAIDNFLYWEYPWFDVGMHLLGGVAIATFLIAFLKDFRPRAFLFLAVLAYVGWEVFEYIFGLPRKENYFLDTTIDFLMDAIGSVAAYVVARKTIWRSR